MTIPQPAPCTISPADKRAQGKRVGDDLLTHYGKRRFYTVEQVREANRRQGIGFDVACWSHALFNTHADFDALHAGIGEACDYVGMKQQMLESLSGPSADIPGGTASDWFDFDLSWLEFPDIDLSIFDVFDIFG